MAQEEGLLAVAKTNIYVRQLTDKRLVSETPSLKYVKAYKLKPSLSELHCIQMIGVYFEVNSH